MEEEIRLMDIKALQEYSRQDSCIDDYLFMTDRLESWPVKRAPGQKYF